MPVSYGDSMSESSTVPSDSQGSSADQILYEVDGHVATITLNRPDRLNAITGTMLQQLPGKTEIPNLLVDISQTGLAAGLDEITGSLFTRFRHRGQL